MNAILQSLFSLPSFSNDMLKQSIPWKKVPTNALLRYCRKISTASVWANVYTDPRRIITVRRMLTVSFTSLSVLFTLCRRFAHLMLKKDVSCPETKKDLLRKVKNAISSTAERFSGNMQNVSSRC